MTALHARRRGVIAASELWTPAELPNALWYPVHKMTGIANGGTVQTWQDFGGDSRHLTQATSGSRATFVTNVLNGKAVLRFDGTADHYVFPYAATTGWSSIEAFLVVKVDLDPPTDSSKSGLWQMTNITSGATGTHYPFTDGVIYDSFGTTARKTIKDPASSLSSWRLYNVDSRPNVYEARLDGTTLISFGINTVGLPQSNARIGRSQNDLGSVFYHFDGDMADLIITPALTTADRDLVHGYIAGTYGLAV